MLYAARRNQTRRTKPPARESGLIVRFGPRIKGKTYRPTNTLAISSEYHDICCQVRLEADDSSRL